MDLAKQTKIISNIRDTLKGYIGQQVHVRANLGRAKIIECDGLLVQVHPRLFVLEVQRKRARAARQSYQFSDVLTGVVTLSQNGTPLFPEPFIKEEPVVINEPPIAPNPQMLV